jgi:hypothetical protein
MKLETARKEKVPMDPRQVRSPRNKWTLIEVLVDNGGDDDSLVVGEWEGARVLAARWNGEGKKIGNPQSRGLPTWFILPHRYYVGILATLPQKKRALANTLLKRDK